MVVFCHSYAKGQVQAKGMLENLINLPVAELKKCKIVQIDKALANVNDSNDDKPYMDRLSSMKTLVSLLIEMKSKGKGKNGLPEEGNCVMSHYIYDDWFCHPNLYLFQMCPEMVPAGTT